jgi:hypothetical protein
MIVTFNHPPTGTVNPFQDFTPGNIQHYPEEPGVYVFGLKIPIQGANKFIPLYVGIAKSLRKRLWQHYREERTGGNSKWYVFDYANVKNVQDVIELYKSMSITDSYKRLNNQRFSTMLIWFNNAFFFDHILKLKRISTYLSNSGVLASILNNGDLDQIQKKAPSSNAVGLKSTIINAKAIFDDGFYFVYSGISKYDISINQDHPLFALFNQYIQNNSYMNGRKNGPGRSMAERIESATKEQLNQINLKTAAAAKGQLFNIQINLGKIQDCMINVGSHNYNISSGNYIKPLILP